MTSSPMNQPREVVADALPAILIRAVVKHAATQPGASAGWGIPRVPTPEMDAAGKQALRDNGSTEVDDSDALVCWEAMYSQAMKAAALRTPAKTEGEVGRALQSIRALVSPLQYDAICEVFREHAIPTPQQEARAVQVAETQHMCGTDCGCPHEEWDYKGASIAMHQDEGEAVSTFVMLDEDHEEVLPEAATFADAKRYALAWIDGARSVATLQPAGQAAVTDEMVERGLIAARDASDARLARHSTVRAILTASLAGVQHG